MKSLRTILRSNYFYLLLFLTTLIYVIICTEIIEYQSKYSGTENSFMARIDHISIDGDLLKLRLTSNEKLIGSYYFKNEEEKISFGKNYKLGDIVKLVGHLEVPNNNTNPNLFNYKRYLYRNKIFYLLKIEDISLIKNNSNIFMVVKNVLTNRINDLHKSGNYVNAFILGDVGLINEDIQSNYRNIGISHLFSISGMHITLMAMFLFWLLKKVGNIKYFIVLFLIVFYLVVIGFVASAVRASLMFVLIRINKVCKLELDILKLMFLTAFIMIILNPFIIFNIGFQYSCIVSIFLVMFSDVINSSHGYLRKLLMTSYIAFLASIPISLYNFHELNFLAVFNNLLFVPLVNFILFPLSIVTLLFPVLDDLLFAVISFMERLSGFLDIKEFSLVFIRLNIIFYFVYYGVIYLCLKRKKYIFVLILILFIHSNYNFLFKSDYMLMIDVGQGDAILFHSDNKTVLIDTGGSIMFPKEEWKVRNVKYSIAKDTLLPLFKSFGIRKLDYLILTHGDLDHLGEADELIDEFKIDEVLFNNYEVNNNEKKIIELLEKKRIKYSFIRNGDFFEVGNFNFFVGIVEYKNENDNSIVLMVERDNLKILLMGDAPVRVEHDLIKSGFIEKANIVKIGHHGSKTSTSTEFLNATFPDVVLISAGRNNLFKHPNDEVVERLEDRNISIYDTRLNGAVLFKFNNFVSISTYPP